MRNRLTIYEPEINNNQAISAFIKGRDKSSVNTFENNSVSEIMASEGREDFYGYVKGLGLARDRNLVFLSSIHHYYYDADEMKRVKTVINLKELNQIKHLKNFLHSIQHILPDKCNFIGCFVDNTKINGYELRYSLSADLKRNNQDELDNGVVSENPFLNRLYSLIDLKTNKFMSGNMVSLLLGDYGFKVIDMREINGLTYFHAQKVSSSVI
jgi:hypothetical protein